MTKDQDYLLPLSAMLFANLGPIEVKNLLNSSTISLSCVTFFPWSTLSSLINSCGFRFPVKQITYCIPTFFTIFTVL